MHAVTLLLVLGLGDSPLAADPPAKPASHTLREIEGWTVRIDDRLLAGDGAALGEQATTLLGDRLRDIGRSLGDERLAQLRRVVIQLDLSHGALDRMQYHPSAAWLAEHGYAVELEKCVHIPAAAEFASPRHQQVQPWSVMHELSHAYHDQQLGYDNETIRLAWEAYKSSDAGADVLHVDGRTTRHYALTNPQEFFAEMSEAYLGRNDFFPFVRGELEQSLPAVHRLMRESWGPLR